MTVRVLHLSWEYPPLVYGGLGRHVHGLAEAQAAAGHDVVVVTQHPGDDGVPHDEVVRGVRVLRAAHPSGLPATEVGADGFLAWVADLDAALARAVGGLARTGHPDVVHAHDWVVGAAASAVHRRLRVPVVATVHATEAGRHQGWVVGDLSHAVHEEERRLTVLAARVVVCSSHMRWEVTRLFGLADDEVDVVANGIDLATWRATAREIASARSAYAGDGPLVVVAGRLEWEKGVHTLVAAVPALRRKFPGLRVVVVGHGSQREELEALTTRLRVSRAVAFAGWLTGAGLRAVVAAADVAVVPSVYEPFGLAALEAMALGTPVVASEVGGLTDVVRDGTTGLTVPALDHRALADAVTTVLRDDALARRLARAARRAAARDHDWRAVAGATVAVYERALREPRPRRRRTVPPPGDGNLLRDVP